MFFKGKCLTLWLVLIIIRPMKHVRLLTLCLLFSLTGSVANGAKSYTRKSPNGRITATVSDHRRIDVALDGRTVVSIDAALNGLRPEVRVFDEGVAYRFTTKEKGETIVRNEVAEFRFPAGAKAWLAYSTNKEKPFAMAFQNTYSVTALSDTVGTDRLAFLPATVDVGSGTKVTILESDLRSYPGMFLRPGRSTLTAVFPPYPKRMDYYRWRGMSYVAEAEDYIAKSSGARTYPWRIVAITDDDRQMPVCPLVSRLAEPSRIADTSWIRPGKVAWDWWNDWNLRGVDFLAGINTATYRYYIDFAARYGLPYIILDEGWYDSSRGDLMHPIAAIDLEQLIDYGCQKGVGIVLWTVFNVLDEHLQEACAKYAAMGAKGFKVDFLDRNDQTAVEMAERIADACAQHRLILDYHGFYTPTGLDVTYPNILNYEAVFGMEECRWAKKTTDMPLYDVTFPFIRGMAGPVDFTPGAMRNGTRSNWTECYEKPVSMGTRCHQAACYVVHRSPFTMLCDAPTSYEQEPDYTRFIASVPDVWDEARVLQGEMGKYIVVARRKGSTWYVGGQTNWDARDVTLPLDFLGPGSWQATLLTDGINANHNAEDYRFSHAKLTTADRLPLSMASGGGFVVKLEQS